MSLKKRIYPWRVHFAAFALRDEAEYLYGLRGLHRGGPYGMFRTMLFAKTHHLPCAPPPWGTLTAVDMATGTIRWQVPLGSLSPGNPAIPSGAPSLGGPIVTAGRLVFIAGTVIDPSFRAFDVETG